MNGARIGANPAIGADATTEDKAILDNSPIIGAPAKVVRDPDAKAAAAFREAPSSSSET